MRVVLDPNVLISALISPAGHSAQIVHAWTEERFELIVSPQLLAELAEVLDRPKFRRWVSAHGARDFIAGLAEDAQLVDDPPPPTGATPDPRDDYLVGLARTAQADAIVSGDSDLTGLIDSRPPVLTPHQFIRQLAHLED